MKNKDFQTFFSDNILQWYDHREKRALPWKEGNNPYFIWLSEVMLQQTRVEQGLPYYLKFVEHFPEICDLANAEEDEIMKLWQGLGYYARARNMHAAARYICSEYGGIFPKTYQEIRNLKGVGDYSAAAIASFAYGLPYAVLDGNVYRVLSRFFGIEVPIDSNEGKKLFSALAQDLLNIERAGDYNQAIMDFGALHCKPSGPLCNSCPLVEHCIAFQEKTIEVLPVKSKKLLKKTRHFCYLIWKSPSGETVLQKRSDKDIWQGLYEFPLIEIDAPIVNNEDFNTLWKSGLWQEWTATIEAPSKMHKISTTYRQVLTHQNILAIFVQLEENIPNYFRQEGKFTVIPLKNLGNFAVPKIIQAYLSEELLIK